MRCMQKSESQFYGLVAGQKDRYPEKVCERERVTDSDSNLESVLVH